MGNDIVYIDKQTGEQIHITVYNDMLRQLSPSLKCNVITDKRGLIWVSVNGNGVFVYDMEDDSLIAGELFKTKAAELLSESESITISEVAYQVGINNAQYFSVNFKKMFGVTPSAYQKGTDKSISEPAR